MFEETAKGGTMSVLLQGRKTFGGLLAIHFTANGKNHRLILLM